MAEKKKGSELTERTLTEMTGNEFVIIGYLGKSYRLPINTLKSFIGAISSGGTVDLTNVASHIIPYADNAYNIGSESKLWATIFAKMLSVGGTTFSVDADGVLVIDAIVKAKDESGTTSSRVMTYEDMGAYALKTALNDYITSSDLDTKLNAYVTSSALTTALKDYCTSSYVDYLMQSTKSSLQSQIEKKQPIGDYALKSYVDGAIDDILGGASGAYDTLKEIEDILKNDTTGLAALLEEIGTKADKSTVVAINSRVSDLEDADFVDIDSLRTTLESYYTKGEVDSLLGEAGGVDLTGYVNEIAASETGNGIASVSKDGSKLTFTKATFLTDATVPAARALFYGGIKIGYKDNGKNYGVLLDDSGKAYVNVPWESYDLSKFLEKDGGSVNYLQVSPANAPDGETINIGVTANEISGIHGNGVVDWKINSNGAWIGTNQLATQSWANSNFHPLTTVDTVPTLSSSNLVTSGGVAKAVAELAESAESLYQQKITSTNKLAYSLISGTPTLATVATSGSYNDLTNKPTIPSAITESTVSGWGFTKNAGTITGIKMNGASKGTSGVVDLGTVLTSHQTIHSLTIKPSDEGYSLTYTPNSSSLSITLGKSWVGLGNVENKSSATIRGEITSSNVTTALGYTPYNSANFTKANIKSTLGISDWALASSKPTYTAAEVGALPLSGGTLKSAGWGQQLNIWRETTGTDVLIGFRDNGGWLGYLGFREKSKPYFMEPEGTIHTLIHSGNIGDYTLAKDSNGTVLLNGTLYVDGAGASIEIKEGAIKSNLSGTDSWSIDDSGNGVFNSLKVGSNDVIHSGNIGSQSVANASKLGGIDAGSFFCAKGTGILNNEDANDYWANGVYLNQTGNGSNNTNFPQTYSIFVNFTSGQNQYVSQLSLGTNYAYYRTKIDNWGAWIAFITSNNIGSYAVTPSNLESTLSDYPLANGTRATGTWDINISGRANRLEEIVVTDLNSAPTNRIFTMTSGYGSKDGNKPTEWWVSGITFKMAQNDSYRTQLCTSDDEYLYYRAEHAGSWIPWKRIAFTDSTVAAAQKLVTSAGADVLTHNNFNIFPIGGIVMNPNAEGMTIGYNSISWHNSSNVWTKDILYVNSSGNVTIGSSDYASNAYKLYVSGPLYVTDTASLTNINIHNISDANYVASIRMETDGVYLQPRKEGVGYLNTILNNRGGNVGIGTTNPAYKLDVAGGVRIDGDINFGEGTDNRQFVIHKDGVFTFYGANGGWAFEMMAYGYDKSTRLGTSAGSCGTTNTLKYHFYGGNWDNPYMVILPNANVGIGTTNPNTKLHVVGGAKIEGALSTYGITATTTAATDAAFTHYVGSTKLWWVSSYNNCANFNTALYVQNGSSPIKVATVNDLSSYLPKAGGTISGSLTFSSTSGSHIIGNANNVLQLQPGTGSNPVLPIKIAKLSSGRHTIYCDEDQAYDLGTSSYSYYYVYSRYSSASSDETKKNIIGNIPLTTAQIANAPAVSFTWKDSGEKSHGTIAQYWKEILPEFVSGEEGSYGLNYAALGVVSAIILARNIETHEQRIARLEKEISDLQKELNALVNNE